MCVHVRVHQGLQPEAAAADVSARLHSAIEGGLQDATGHAWACPRPSVILRAGSLSPTPTAQGLDLLDGTHPRAPPSLAQL